MAKAKRVADYNSTFAVRLRGCMEKQGITQSELAQDINKTRQAVNNYTLGETVPDADTLILISKRLGVSVDYLLGLSDAAAIDTNIQDIHKLTGLSEKAIDMLMRVNDSLSILDSLDKKWIDTINFLLETAQIELPDGLLQIGILPKLTNYLMNGAVSNTSDLYIVTPSGAVFKSYDEAIEYADSILKEHGNIDETTITHAHTGEYVDIVTLDQLKYIMQRDRKLFVKETATDINISVAE